MTLGLGIFLAGVLLIYAGIAGKSPRSLLTGDSTKSSQVPAPVERVGGR